METILVPNTLKSNPNPNPKVTKEWTILHFESFNKQKALNDYDNHINHGTFPDKMKSDIKRLEKTIFDETSRASILKNIIVAHKDDILTKKREIDSKLAEKWPSIISDLKLLYSGIIDPKEILKKQLYWLIIHKLNDHYCQFTTKILKDLQKKELKDKAFKEKKEKESEIRIVTNKDYQTLAKKISKLQLQLKAKPKNVNRTLTNPTQSPSKSKKEGK